MKKVITICLLVITLLVGGMTTYGKTTKKKSSKSSSSASWNGDIPSAAVVDPLVQVEDNHQEEEAAQAASEQAHLDFIRQDSIVQEEEMKLGQLSFISHNGDWKKILPKFGFKLTSKKTHIEPSDYNEEATWEITDYVYNRNLNGRKVTFEFSRIYERGPRYEGRFGRDYCATMIIHDPNERKRFIQDVKKLNKMKGDEEYGEIWQASNIDHYIRYWKGVFI